MTKLRIRDLLTDDEYLTQRRELERMRLAVGQGLEVLENSRAWLEPGKALVSFNASAVPAFRAGENRAKRLILTGVGSNLVLRDKILSIEAKKPFRRWTETASRSEMLAYVKDVRTFLTSPPSAEILAAIKQLEQLHTSGRSP